MNKMTVLMMMGCWIAAGAAAAVDGGGKGGAPAGAQGFQGMAVQDVREREAVIEVQTTGAEFVFDKVNNVIDCYQRIPLRRKVAAVSGIVLKELRVKARSASECTLVTGKEGKASIVIAMDSMMSLPLAAKAAVTVAGAYKPEYIGIEEPHLLLPDEQGGIGAYLVGAGQCRLPAAWDTGWQVSYTADAPSHLLLSVFPPRPFDWKQACETMVHTFSWKNPYPSDEQLKEWSTYGSILALHSWIWKSPKGESKEPVMMDDSWAVATYVPRDEKEMVRVVETAHRLGMKVIPYMSPYYFTGGTIDDFVKAVGECMKKYKFDGVYFDGIRERYNDIMGAYEVTRKTRQAIGNNGILYIHATISPLKKIYCPFIDCYADYLLRGEHRNTSEDSFRWYVSSYNLGNAVGTLCYDTQRPTSEMINLIFRVNARLPVWVDDGTWNKKEYFLHKPEMELMKAEYFPKLKKEAATHK